MKQILSKFFPLCLLVSFVAANAFAYYDPSVGKWLSRDPEGEQAGPNLTAFCNNDPVNNVDPLGLAWVKEGGDVIPHWYSYSRDPLEEIVLSHLLNNVIGVLNAALPVAGQTAEAAIPQPQDYITGSRMMDRGMFGARIPLSDRAKLTGLGLFVGVMGLMDVADVVPDPTDPLQKAARAIGQEVFEKTLRKTTESSTRYVRKSLPELTGSFRAAFEGVVRTRTFKKGEKVYRSPWTPKELLDTPGAWLGTRRTTTKAGTEFVSNVAKWGNPLEKLRAYEFTEDVTVYYGKVAGGTGYQVLIPEGIDPASVLRFVEEAILE